MQAVRPAGDGPLKAPRQYIKSKRRRATAICTDGSLKSECVLVCVLTDLIKVVGSPMWCAVTVSNSLIHLTLTYTLLHLFGAEFVSLWRTKQMHSRVYEFSMLDNEDFRALKRRGKRLLYIKPYKRPPPHTRRVPRPPRARSHHRCRFTIIQDDSKNITKQLSP